jgi:integrase/recombinase XerD
LRKRYKKGLLFVNPKTEKEYVDLRKPLKRAAEKAGIDQHVYMHLLRHSFGTHSIQSGIGLRTLQMLMGHSSSQVTEIYTTLAGQYLGQEIEKFGRGAMRHSKQPKKPKKPVP